GAFLFLRRRPREKKSGLLGFSALGAASGALTGLFSIGGPPLVYHYYRQPVTLAAVRATLLTSFALMSAARLLLVAGQGGLMISSVGKGLIAVPVVALASWLCTRFPPKIRATTIRYTASIMLAVMGVIIIYMAASEL